LQLSAAINAEHQHAHQLRQEEKQRLEREGAEKLEAERKRRAKEKLERDKKERQEKEELERDLQRQIEALAIGSPERTRIELEMDALSTSPTITTEFKLTEKCHECKGTKEMAKWVY